MKCLIESLIAGMSQTVDLKAEKKDVLKSANNLLSKVQGTITLCAKLEKDMRENMANVDTKADLKELLKVKALLEIMPT